MRIRFEATMKDYLATFQNNLKNSPAKKNSRRLGLLICGLFILAGMYQGISAGDWLQAGILMGGGVLQIIIEPLMHKFMMPQILKKMLKGENARGIIGWHELEILPDGLIDRTEYKETKYAWAMLDHIESTDTHTFIYFGKLNPIGIPHQGVTEGSLPVFLKTLGEQYAPNATLQNRLAE